MTFSLKVRNLFLFSIVLTQSSHLIFSPALFPYWDDWEICRPLLGQSSWVEWILAPHVEHIAAIPKFLLAIASSIVGVPVLFAQIFGLGLRICSFFCLAHFSFKEGIGKFGLVLMFFLLLPTDWENLSMGWQFHLELSFAALVFAILFAKERFGFALLLAGVAMVSYGGGFLALIIFFLLTEKQQVRGKLNLMFVAAFIGLIGVFFVSKTMAPALDATINNLDEITPFTDQTIVSGSWSWFTNSLGILGASFVPEAFGYRTCVMVGLALVFLAIESVVHGNRVLVTFVAVAIAYCVLVAWGRAAWGANVITVSRYFLFPKLIAVPIALRFGNLKAPAWLKGSILIVAASVATTTFFVALQKSIDRANEVESHYCCALEKTGAEKDHCLSEITPNPRRAESCIALQKSYLGSSRCEGSN